MEVFKVDCGAVVGVLVATALLQLALVHQRAVQVQLDMAGADVKVLTDGRQLQLRHYWP